MNVTILYNEPRAWAAADERDVLAQADWVASALAANGHSVTQLACGLDMEAVAASLAAMQPDLAFNLVEGLGGYDRLYAVLPSLLDALDVPYSGNSAEAIFLTTNKLIAKERLAAAGLPTPAVPLRWPETNGAGGHAFTPGRYILKPVWEHASLGMGDDAVVDVETRDELAACLAAVGERTGRSCFAEAFVDGRELNLSLLADGDGGVDLLPHAEIDFAAYPAGKPRIVGWAAKWVEGSFEYDHTPRRFDFPADDAPLLAELERLARACWDLFGLRGYARVDFRIDAAGQPYILEVNTNPCISPESGFAAAVEEAGLSFPAAVARIIAAAPLRRMATARVEAPAEPRPLTRRAVGAARRSRRGAAA
jgi:D-alanine-D-alanine ligase